MACSNPKHVPSPYRVSHARYVSYVEKYAISYQASWALAFERLLASLVHRSGRSRISCRFPNGKNTRQTHHSSISVSLSLSLLLPRRPARPPRSLSPPPSSHVKEIFWRSYVVQIPEREKNKRELQQQHLSLPPCLAAPDSLSPSLLLAFSLSRPERPNPPKPCTNIGTRQHPPQGTC